MNECLGGVIGNQTVVTRLNHTRVNAEVDFLETETFAQVNCDFYIETLIILIVLLYIARVYTKHFLMIREDHILF